MSELATTNQPTPEQQEEWDKTREQDPKRAEWKAWAEKPHTEDAMVLEEIRDRTQDEMNREWDHKLQPRLENQGYLRPSQTQKHDALSQIHKGTWEAAEASRRASDVAGEEASKSYERRKGHRRV